MTFEMVAKPHVVLFYIDEEIPGDRRNGAINGYRGGAYDAVYLARSPGGYYYRITYDAPSLGYGR